MKRKFNSKYLIIALVVILVLVSFLVFSKPKYKVTFLDEDGSVYNSVRVAKGKLCPLLDGPSKTGYKFYKWMYEGKSFDFSLPITQNIALTAKYIKEYTITLLNADGSLFTTIYAGEGEKLSLPSTTPKQENMAFNGWLYNGSAYNTNTIVTENFSLTASFRPYVKAEAIAYEYGRLQTVLGEKIAPRAIVTPLNATETIVYTSSDNTIFTVDTNGVVTPHKAGTAVLTAKIEGFSATCNVTIIEIYPDSFTPTILIDDESVEVKDKLYVGIKKNVTIIPIFEPENTSAKTLTYDLSKTGIAKIDAYGNITGVKAGEVELTMRTQRLPEQTVKVIVFTPLDKVELKSDKTTIKTDETLDINLELSLVKIEDEKKKDGTTDESSSSSENSNTSTTETNSSTETDKDSKDKDKEEVYVEKITYDIEWTCLDSKGNESKSFEITPSKDNKSVTVKATKDAKEGDTCLIRANVTEPDGNKLSTKAITIELVKK